MKMKKGFQKFMIIWIGELISNIGSGMTAFGLGIYVWEITHSAVSVSLVELAAFLPMILLSPVAGVLADRYDRRILMILGDAVSAIGLIAMFFIMSVTDIAIWQICICVAFDSAFVSLLDPAYKATITDLVTEDEYTKASGMMSIASSSKFLISPVIGGLLFAAFGMKLILLIDILTVVVTVCAIFTVSKSIAKKPVSKADWNFFKEAKEGMTIIVKNKGVLELIVLVSLLTFYLGFIQVLSKPMILPLCNEKITGILQTVCACGMLFSSILIGSGNFKRKYVDVMVTAFIVSGISMIGFGATPNIIVITIFGFLFFCALPYANTSLDVLVRRSIENDKQGRAWGLISLISQLGFVVAYALAGILSDYIFNPSLQEGGVLSNTVGKIIGTGETRGIGLLIMITGILMIVTALYIMRSKTIRALETNGNT